jgi:hypothetical protein
MTQEQEALALLIECEEKQDPLIQHEWVMESRVSAVRLANYLRQHGYEVENKIYKTIGIPMYYVGVPFKSLKTKQP